MPRRRSKRAEDASWIVDADIIWGSAARPTMSKVTTVESADAQVSNAHRDDVVQGLPAPENKRFYPALDGLRALAVLMVFFEHYQAALFPALNWGWAGVDLFFVLSGFLITGILYDTRDAPHRFRTFYARRTLRIFPLYYGVLLFGVLLTPLFHWMWNRAWILWFLYLGNYARFFYLSSPLLPKGAIEHLIAQTHRHRMPALFLGHFWSLAVEEQFYLVWPFLVFAIRDRVRLRNFCVVVCGLTLLARIVCVFVVPQRYLAAELLYRVTPLRADALLLGGLVALCLRGPEADLIRRLAQPMLVALSAGFLMWEAAYRANSGVHHFYHPYAGAPVLTTIGYTLVDLFAAALIVSVLEPGGSLYELFSMKWPRRLGMISYGFYVFHDMFHTSLYVIVSAYIGFGLKREMSVTLLGLAGTTAIAYLSFRYFESPFLRLKDRFKT